MVIKQKKREDQKQHISQKQKQNTKQIIYCARKSEKENRFCNKAHNNNGGGKLIEVIDLYLPIFPDNCEQLQTIIQNDIHNKKKIL